MESGAVLDTRPREAAFSVMRYASAIGAIVVVALVAVPGCATALPRDSQPACCRSATDRRLYAVIPATDNGVRVIQVADVLSHTWVAVFRDDDGMQRTVSFDLSRPHGPAAFAVAGRESVETWHNATSALNAIATDEVACVSYLRTFALPDTMEGALDAPWVIAWMNGTSVKSVVCSRTKHVVDTLRAAASSPPLLPPRVEPLWQGRAYRARAGSHILRTTESGRVEVMGQDWEIRRVMSDHAARLAPGIDTRFLAVCGPVSNQQFGDVAAAYEAVVTGTIAPPTDHYAIWVLPLMPSPDFLLYRPDGSVEQEQ
jgi:hypothetical protein